MILAVLFAVQGAGEIAVQHEGRVKPLDSFARQLVQFLTEKETFEGYRDPGTREWVAVFPGGDPVRAVLGMIALPREVHRKRFLKIAHPGLKAKLGLEASRTYFSLGDLESVRGRMAAEAQAIDDETANSEDRALLKVLHQIATVEGILAERLLAIFPFPQGENRTWMTPSEVREWLRGRRASPILETHVRGDSGRRAALTEAMDRYDAAVAALARGDDTKFAGLAEVLRALNPGVVPSGGRIRVEVTYNRIRPFHWACLVYFISALAFLGALVFRRGWSVALAILVAGLVLTGFGYALRWIIAGRYPLSNHYESMVMCALAAALAAVVCEILARSKSVLGMSGALVASLLLVLANNVPAFAEQGFVAPLVPALQTVWMTIHVPVIMTGYALGMLLMVLGHVFLLRTLRRDLPPDEEKRMDTLLYRVLQATVIFLLAGIVTGAVWAGEAWGRPWGWDMKETWALITLVSYLAILHARFLGILRTFGTSIASLAAFQILVLTYYGVNFVFGKGLHTYGFGAGEVWPLVAFFAVEALFAGACGVRRLRRKAGPRTEAHDMVPAER